MKVLERVNGGLAMQLADAAIAKAQKSARDLCNRANGLRATQKAAVAGALMILADFASATSVYDPLTSAVSVTDIIAALFAVAAVVAALPVARSGIRAVLKALHFS